MTNTCETIICDRPAGDGTVCRTCLAHLEQVLAETRWIMNELDIVIRKDTQYAPQGGKVTNIGAAQPMPIHLQASDVRSDFAAKLGLWTADVSRSQRHTALAMKDPSIAGGWLLAHLEDVRTHPAAGDLIDELCQAYATALYVIDRPFERKYLGECGADNEGAICSEPLWAREGDSIAVCRTCGAEWDTPARLEAIQKRAAEGLEDRLMTATQAAETITAYNIGLEDNPVKVRDRIRKWAEQPDDPERRPRLMKRTELQTPGQRRRPAYRFGDIVDLIHETDEKRRPKSA